MGLIQMPDLDKMDSIHSADSEVGKHWSCAVLPKADAVPERVHLMSYCRYDWVECRLESDWMGRKLDYGCMEC